MLFPLLNNFDAVNGVKEPSGLHNSPDFVKDLDLLVEHLKQYDILLTTRVWYIKHFQIHCHNACIE